MSSIPLCSCVLSHEAACHFVQKIVAILLFPRWQLLYLAKIYLLQEPSLLRLRASLGLRVPVMRTVYFLISLHCALTAAFHLTPVYRSGQRSKVMLDSSHEIKLKTCSCNSRLRLSAGYLPTMHMKLGYTLLYVEDVEATMDFYTKAFGLETNFLHDSKAYGEMKTGETKLGFVQHGLASSHGFEYEKVSSGSKPPGMEIGFISDDVAAAFQKAIDAGAKPLQEPKTKPWGQVVSYVKDCNGFIIEICSAV